jgi:hypothetical protein
MTENPSKFLSGSFEPVQTRWEEWVEDACDPSLPVLERDKWRSC